MVFKSILNLLAAKRVPLIKFRGRGGGPALKAAAPAAKAAAPAAKAAAPAAKAAAPAAKPKPSSSKPSISKSKGPVIEDWQLPPRYRRMPIGALEIDYINSGGPPVITKKKKAPAKPAPKKPAAKPAKKK